MYSQLVWSYYTRSHFVEWGQTAINILATFVHNEPTSLTVIQEAGVPEAFYKAVEAGLEPVIEASKAYVSLTYA